MNPVQTSAGRRISVGRKIASGGEGAVFEVAGDSNLVIKIYHDKVEPVKVRKLKHMVAAGTPTLTRHAAWPVDLAEGSRLGILMPKVGGEEMHDVFGPKSRMVKFPSAKYRFLLAVAYNLCAALDEIHKASAVVGDFNLKNVLVSSNASVCFIDCDSFQFSAGNELFKCPVAMADYLAPEMHGADFQTTPRTTNHDNFTLAVLIFQLLFLGRHPFAGVGGPDLELPDSIRRHLYAYGGSGRAAGIRPPTPSLPLDAIPAPMVGLFEKAFSPAAVSGTRPTPSEWGKEITAFGTHIIQCATNSSHEYLAGRSSCPWCEMYSKHGVSFFLLDHQHAFHIDGKSLEDLIARLRGLHPPLLALPAEKPVPDIVGKPPSEELAGKGSEFWFGLMLLAGSIPLFFTGHWIWGSIVLWTAYNLFKKDANAGARSSARKALSEQAVAAERKVQACRTQISAIHRAYEDTFEREKRRGIQAWSEYEDLPARRVREIGLLQNKLRELQLEEFLDSIFVAHATIPGIGPERKNRLRLHGIETAADITSNLGIPGFGSTLTQALLRWKAEKAARFQFDPSKKLHPREIQKVDVNLLAVKQQLENTIKGTPQRLEACRTKALHSLELAQMDLRSASISMAQAKANLVTFNGKYPEQANG